jgi:hypothetical protein
MTADNSQGSLAAAFQGWAYGAFTPGAASLQLSLAWEWWAFWHLLSLFSGRVWLQSLHLSPGCTNDLLRSSMVDTESSGSETNLVVHSAQHTCRAQMSSKESKEIVFHNAEPWYPAKFGLGKKPRRFFCVLRLQKTRLWHIWIN